MKKMFLPLLCALLAACSGSQSSSTTNEPNAGTGVNAPAPTSRPIIDNEDLTPGLKGVDANQNGIRDDIDRLIASKYSASPATKKAAEQKARALQKFMEANTRKEVLIAGDESMRASECLYITLPNVTPDEVKFRERLSEEIEALTANTQERFQKYWKSNETAGGAVFLQPHGTVCD